MDPFSIIPNEKIYEICERLPTSDLNNLIQTHTRIYQVCSEILEERKESEREARKLKGTTQFLLPQFIDPKIRSVSLARITKMANNRFMFDQIDRSFVRYNPTKTSWLLEGFKEIQIERKTTPMGNNFSHREVELNNITELAITLRRLKDKGYIKANLSQIANFSRKGIMDD